MASRTFKLKDVCSVLSGFAFKSNFFSDAGMPLIRIRDVVRGFTETCYAGDYDEKYVVQNGDILIGMDGDFNLEYWEGGPALLNQRVCKVTPDESVLNKVFLYYFLPMKLKEIWEATPYVTVKHLSSKDVEGIEIPAWPLETQQHIARVLEQADQLRKQAQQMESELNQLALALFLEMFGDPRVNNRHLPKKALGEIIKLKSGEFLPATDMRSSGGIPVYGGNGVSGYHDKALFETPKIVIGRVGAYCGAVHRTVAPCWITDNALYVESTVADINITYLEHALRMANLNQYSSQSGQPLVSGSRIYPVEILFPSPVEQEKFEVAMMEIERRKLDADHFLQEKTALFNALMQRAFNGELTERKAA